MLFLSLDLPVTKALVIYEGQRQQELKGQRNTKKKQMLSVRHYFMARISMVVLKGEPSVVFAVVCGISIYALENLSECTAASEG